MTTTTHTHVLLMSAAPEQASICLQVDAAGRVLGREQLTDAQPFRSEAAKVLLVVPGTEVRATWLDLPARNPVQALAAARIMLADQIAGATQSLHIAIAPAQAGQPRLLALVERELLQAWLQRAAALGIRPVAVIPDHLLAPASADETPTGAVTALASDTRWIVRGNRLAFSAETALAMQVVGDRPLTVIEDSEQIEHSLALAQACPAIDLLQHEFAHRPPPGQRNPGYRRLAWFTLVLAISPLLLWSAQALRYELAARSLRADTRTQVGTALSISGPIANPAKLLRARMTKLNDGDTFFNGVGAFFAAISDLQGVHLDGLDYSAGQLRATVIHPRAEDIQALRTAMSTAGWRLKASDSRTVAGGLHSRVIIRPRP